MKQLPVVDRLDLLEELQVSIAKDQGDIPVTAGQLRMIEERVAKIDAEPQPARYMPLDDFRKKLGNAAKGLRAGSKRKLRG